VPFAPGRGTDMIARAIAQEFERQFGKSFVIENPGM
jgi:tripartite-type tricarboxylate transporter receptor subunit TctC